MERKSRDLAGLRTGDSKLDERLQQAGKRIGSLAASFENLVGSLQGVAPTKTVRRTKRGKL